MVLVGKYEKNYYFGNSGSGKSTLAKEYSEQYSLPHLDLDSLAWKDSSPPVRRSLEDSFRDINQFVKQHDSWVIEGCYSDLLSFITQHSSQIIFINPGVDTCIENCKNRPWEPHKYESKQAQDDNLNMLIKWIKQYDQREDEFSLYAHRKLFDQFNGNKVEFNSNKR